MNLTTARVLGGYKVAVGDYVGFKSDIEQYGRIVKIEYRVYGSPRLVLAPAGDHFEGEYIRDRHTTTIPAHECWVD